MYRLWDAIVGPLLEAARPKSIVEIGSERGPNTRNLLDFCERTGATLHAVDPAPQFDVDELRERYGEHFVFHRALSLEAIPRIDRMDAVLIDGDHNWYTVHSELEAIEERSAALSRPFPLVLLHDVGWPYGRRDLYYVPETIPEEHRRPYDRRGMRPGMAGLLGEGEGMNQNVFNATIDGGERNGVLTAVEDFMAETDQELEFVKVLGLHGVGVLVPSRLKRENGELGELLEALDVPPVIARHIERLDEAWLNAEIRRAEVQRRIKGVQEEARAARAELESERAALQRRATALEQRAKQRAEDVRRLTRWIEGLNAATTAMLNSRQWRTVSALNGLRRRALRKPHAPWAPDRIEAIMRQFREWKRNRGLGRADGGKHGDRSRKTGRGDPDG